MISNCCSCFSGSPLTYCITTSTLLHIIGTYLWVNIFSLSDLRTIFHTISLLDEKHISVILRGLNYLRSSSSIFNVHSKPLIWLRTLRPVMVITHVVRSSNHLVVLAMLTLRALRGTICCPEASKAGWVHLLLQEIAWTSIVNIWIIYSFNQVLRIAWSWAMCVEWTSSSRFGLHGATINHIIDVLHMTNSSCWCSILKLRILSLRAMKKFFDIIGILALVVLSWLPINACVCPFDGMLIPRTCLGSSIHVRSIIGVVYAWSWYAI